MTEATQAGAEAAPETPVIAFEKPVDAPDRMNAREAAQLLSSLRKKSSEAPPPAKDPEPVATATESTAQAEDAAPPEVEAPGETQDADPAALPPIEPPRSWTKDEKEEFATYPREAQEKIARREQERDAATRRSQNEAAEKLKGLTAKEQQVETARQQYESALPILLQNLQAQMAGEFSDIKSHADIQKMAAEDWPRYIRWDAQQKQVAAVQQEVIQATQRQVTEKQTKLSEFMKRETELFAEKVPEIKDQAAREKLMTASVDVLKDLGFQDDELGQLWRGEKDISIHDHRLHLLIRDGVRWRDAQKARTEAQRKPVPPVQRPGVAPSKGAQVQAQVQTLARKLETAKGNQAARIAADLMKLRRRQAR